MGDKQHHFKYIEKKNRLSNGSWPHKEQMNTHEQDGELWTNEICSSAIVTPGGVYVIVNYSSLLNEIFGK